MLDEEIKQLRDEAKAMFYHGYDAYMKNAYPADELMPLSCRGRFRGIEANRGDIDDALGNFSLTLIDSLDALVLFNNLSEFERSVAMVVKDVNFDNDVVVSVFETNIRVIGGLVSGHIFAVYVRDKLGTHMQWYNDELLEMAKDLGYRLLPAFNTTTGIPHPRVNLKHGLNSPKLAVARDTCTACAGTMILEFAALTRLTGDSIFEIKARKALDYLWQQRHRASDLVGTVLNIHNGDWIRRESGVGAGIDSYYEYLLKAYVLLGDEQYFERFQAHYEGVMKYVSKGPLLIDVQMHRPRTNSKNFMDALLAFWPGLQVLNGDIKPAVATHEILYQVVQKHNYLMPEAFTVSDFQVHWGQHLIRPEFLESTYFLYKATGDHHYLEVGKQILRSLQKYSRTDCGFAAVTDVRTGSQEDRMDSFVLAETLKYLYLLFTSKEDLIIDLDDYIFTTEAHLLPLTLSQKPLPNATSSVNSLSSNSPKSCPNAHYLSEESKNVYREIRQNLKDYVASNGKSAPASTTCSQSTAKSTRKPRISAQEFSATNQDHLDYVKKMGIAVVLMPDGRIQLIHSSSSAASVQEAEEGAAFMQEMINRSKEQLAVAENQLRLVSFTSPKTNIVIKLPAGPAQFGKDLTQLDDSLFGYASVSNPLKACDSPLMNAAELMGKIAIVERGDCMFIQKVRNVQDAGAIACIVMDNVPHTTSDTLPMFALSGDGKDDITIPAVFLYGKEGSSLISYIIEFPEIIVELSVVRGSSKLDGGSDIHDSNKWKLDVDDDEDEDDDDEASVSVEQPQGIAHITEVTSEIMPEDNEEKSVAAISNQRSANKYIEELLTSVLENSLKRVKEVFQSQSHKMATKDKAKIGRWINLLAQEASLVKSKRTLNPVNSSRSFVEHILQLYKNVCHWTDEPRFAAKILFS